MGIWDWSKTAGSNTTLEGVSWAEGMNAANVNNGQRAIAAALKEFQEDIGGALVSTGSANSYAVTTNGTIPALADGVCIAFIANHANTGAATLNVDSQGAKFIRKGGDVALASGDIPSGMLCRVGYDASANSGAGAWMLENPYVNTSSFYSSGGTDVAVADGGTGASTAADARTNLGLAIGTDVQAYDADLTTIAALAKTDGGFIVGDGTNWVLETGATARASLGLTIGTNVQAYNASLASLAGLTLAAGDTLYSTGANTLANLAKGTANQVLAMNSGATAPEWQTPSSGLSGASQAQMEAASSTSVAVTPGVQHNHPGHPKFWCKVTGTGAPTIQASYNVTSITDTATGRLTVTIATAFSSASWCCQATVETGPPTSGASFIHGPIIDVGGQAAGTVLVELYECDFNGSGAGYDSFSFSGLDPTAWHVFGMGDHA